MYKPSKWVNVVNMSKQEYAFVVMREDSSGQYPIRVFEKDELDEAEKWAKEKQIKGTRTYIRKVDMN